MQTRDGLGRRTHAARGGVSMSARLSAWTQKIGLAKDGDKGVEPSSWTEIQLHVKGTRTMADYVGAIDQGTTSTRFIVFNRSGQIVATAQKEHEQIYPQPGWVEHNPEEIWARTQEVIGEAMQVEGPDGERSRGRRHHQPARDHRRLEPQDRTAGLQRHRLAGHAGQRLRGRDWRSRRSGPVSRARPDCHWRRTSAD